MNSRRGAIFIAVCTTVAALLLVIDRGGLLAWGTLFLGIALLTKMWRKPAGFDMALSTGLAAALVLAWFGTLYYVIATWESGEVVELSIDTSNGVHTARVWVLDIGSHPLVYYDAEPEVARSLLSGEPLQLTRAGAVTVRTPDATQVDALPEAQANLIFESMLAKYGDRVGAADIYYLMLGRSRDRIAVAASLIED